MSQMADPFRVPYLPQKRGSRCIEGEESGVAFPKHDQPDVLPTPNAHASAQVSHMR